MAIWRWLVSCWNYPCWFGHKMTGGFNIFEPLNTDYEPYHCVRCGKVYFF